MNLKQLMILFSDLEQFDEREDAYFSRLIPSEELSEESLECVAAAGSKPPLHDLIRKQQ